MRTLTRCIIILFVAVALLSAIAAALLLNPAGPQSGIIVISDREPIEVKSVTVRNESGFYLFHFDTEENGYVLDDIPPYLANTEAFIDFMTVCSNLTALSSIPMGEIDVAQSQLDSANARAHVFIEFFGGAPINLTIGAQERVSGNFYALVGNSGNAGLYILPQASAQQFLLPKTHFITSFVTPPTVHSSPLSAIGDITFAGGGLAAPVTINTTNGADRDVKLAAMSFGAPTHIVRGTTDYGLDQTYGSEIFGSLLGLRGEIVDYNIRDGGKSEYGFDDPYMTVSFDVQPGPGAERLHLDLHIADAGGGKFYASLGGSGAVFLIGREPFIDVDYPKLPVRWFLTPLLPDLSSVTIESPGAVYRFDIDNTDSRNPVVSYNRRTLSADLFRSFFRLITSAAHDGTYSGLLPLPSGAPLLSVRYEYRNGIKAPDTLTLYPGISQRANVYVNGFGEFAMKDLFARRVLEGAEALISGNTIEENW